MSSTKKKSMSAYTQMEVAVLGPEAANEISKFPLLATTLSSPFCDIRWHRITRKFKAKLIFQQEHVPSDPQV